MNAPTRGVSTNTKQIEIQWLALTTPQNGDSSVLSYNLEWDGGSSGSVYSSLVGYVANSLSTSFLATNGLTAGQLYRFRVRAKNIWGWGPYSSHTTIQAATIPAKMATPTFSVNAFAGDLMIDWLEPDIQGDPISNYLVIIADSSQETWNEYSTICNGLNPLVN